MLCIVMKCATADLTPPMRNGIAGAMCSGLMQVKAAKRDARGGFMHVECMGEEHLKQMSGDTFTYLHRSIGIAMYSISDQVRIFKHLFRPSSDNDLISLITRDCVYCRDVIGFPP